MKTFEEAMNLRMVRQEYEGQEAPGKENFERYASLVKDIGQHPMTHIYVNAIAALPPFEHMDDEEAFHSMLMTAFVNGVMVGIEMEKAE